MKRILPKKNPGGAVLDETKLIDAIFHREFFTLVTYSGVSKIDGVQKPQFKSFLYFKNFFVDFMRCLHGEYTDLQYKQLFQKWFAILFHVALHCDFKFVFSISMFVNRVKNSTTLAKYKGERSSSVKCRKNKAIVSPSLDEYEYEENRDVKMHTDSQYTPSAVDKPATQVSRVPALEHESAVETSDRELLTSSDLIPTAIEMTQPPSATEHQANPDVDPCMLSTSTPSLKRPHPNDDKKTKHLEEFVKPKPMENKRRPLPSINTIVKKSIGSGVLVRKVVAAPSSIWNETERGFSTDVESDTTDFEDN